MLNQVFKGYELAMNSAILLAEETAQLRAANEKKKAKAPSINSANTQQGWNDCPGESKGHRVSCSSG